MARAADNTINFVKEWIAGRLTKSQYMHYYIVETPHAEFMMKANTTPDLVAIKDNSGHVFIIDDILRSYLLEDERAQRNPFFALIHDGYKFSYTLLAEDSLEKARGTQVSKWQTIDFIHVPNESLGLDIRVSLVAIGDELCITEPIMKSIPSQSLELWGDYEDVKKIEFGKLSSHEIKVTPYSKLLSVQGKFTKAADVRKAFVKYAGDNAHKAVVKEEWIVIPSDKETLADLIGKEAYEALKTRPMSYHYGITSDIINLSVALKRTNYPFSPETLDNYDRKKNLIDITQIPNGKRLMVSGNVWREWLKHNIEPEEAKNIIQYIDDDDAWLEKNSYIVNPFAWGRTFKEGVFDKSLCGNLLVLEESNPSIFNTHVAYIKGDVIDSYSNKVESYKKVFHKLLLNPRITNTYSMERVMENVCNGQ